MMRWFAAKTWWQGAVQVAFVGFVASAFVTHWYEWVVAGAITLLAGVVVVLELEPFAWQRLKAVMQNTGVVQDRKRLILGLGLSGVALAIAGVTAGVEGILTVVICATVLIGLRHRGLL